MFIFTLIPLHLLNDSDKVKVNKKNKVDIMEHNVMELEALYTSMLLGQYYNTNTTEVNTYDKNSIKSALDRARERELELRKTEGLKADNNSNARLQYIHFMEKIADIRLNDLSELKTALETDKQLNYTVSAVDNTNINSVKKELEKIQEFRKEIKKAEGFWTEIVALQSKDSTEEEETQIDFSKQDFQKNAITKIRINSMQKLENINTQDQDKSQLQKEEESIRSQLAEQMNLIMSLPVSSKKDKQYKMTELLIQKLKMDLNENLYKQTMTNLSNVINSDISKNINSQISSLTL